MAAAVDYLRVEGLPTAYIHCDKTAVLIPAGGDAAGGFDHLVLKGVVTRAEELFRSGHHPGHPLALLLVQLPQSAAHQLDLLLITVYDLLRLLLALNHTADHGHAGKALFN